MHSALQISVLDRVSCPAHNLANFITIKEEKDRTQWMRNTEDTVSQ
jgi:hypothetical protein